MAKRTADIPVTPSSGNVFADLGLPHPEEELAKATIASTIREVIRRQKLTLVEAARAMQIDQPKVSNSAQPASWAGAIAVSLST